MSYRYSLALLTALCALTQLASVMHHLAILLLGMAVLLAVVMRQRQQRPLVTLPHRPRWLAFKPELLHRGTGSQG